MLHQGAQSDDAFRWKPGGCCSADSCTEIYCRTQKAPSPSLNVPIEYSCGFSSRSDHRKVDGIGVYLKEHRVTKLKLYHRKNGSFIRTPGSRRAKNAYRSRQSFRSFVRRIRCRFNGISGCSGNRPAQGRLLTDQLRSECCILIGHSPAQCPLHLRSQR